MKYFEYNRRAIGHTNLWAFYPGMYANHEESAFYPGKFICSGVGYWPAQHATWRKF